MNVLIVVPWDQTRGGVTTVADQLARHLARHRHRALYLLPGPSLRVERQKTLLGHESVRLNLRTPFIAAHPLRSLAAFVLTLPYTLLQLFLMLRRERIDVVNVHYPTAPVVYFAFLRPFLRFALVVSAHGADFQPGGRAPWRYSWGLRQLVRSCDCLTAPSAGYLDTVLTAFPAVATRSMVVHNGIAVLDFADNTKAQVPAGTPPEFMLCIAAFNEKKAHDVLLHATRDLRRRNVRLPIVLVGDGPLRSQMEQLAASLDVADDVRFVGSQELDVVRGLLRACTFLVLPSRSEPFGIVLLEAMAFGRAVVATRVGGIPEIVSHGNNGLLVEPDNPEQLSSALATLIRDASLREQLGNNGRHVVHERFTQESMGDGFLRVFAHALERARGETQRAKRSVSTLAAQSLVFVMHMATTLTETVDVIELMA